VTDSSHIDRLLSNVTYDGGCWTYTGRLTPTGYGTMLDWKNEHSQRVHRAVYESLVEKLAVGLELDHLCRNRACVNPVHLEPVTHAENMRRARLDRCKRGHMFTPQNTYHFNSRGFAARTCMTCMGTRARERRAEGRG